MRRRPVPPYRQLGETGVRLEPAEGWELEAHGVVTVLPDGQPFPDWDSSLALALRRRVTVNGNALAQLGVSDENLLKLQFVVRMLTCGNRQASVPVRQDLPHPIDKTFEVVVHPEPGSLGQDLVLNSSIVVADCAGTVDPLVPSVPGSRVWEEQWRTRLEGGKVRLPFEVLDFEVVFSGMGMADALFHVDVADDPELDFEQGVCVSVNSRFEAFVSAVARVDPMATAILWDAVLRRVLASGVGAGFDVAGAYPQASVGEQWRRWFGQAFPGETIASAQRMIVEQPSRFEARVQSWSRIASRLVMGLGA